MTLLISGSGVERVFAGRVETPSDGVKNACSGGRTRSDPRTDGRHMPAQGFPPPPPGSAPGGSMPAISLTGSPKAPAWERASREKRGSVSAADGPQCPDTRSRPRYLAGLRPYRGRDRHRRGHASGHRPPAALGLRQDEDERTAARRRLTRRNENRE